MRRPHAVLDIVSRNAKAAKIEYVLKPYVSLHSARLLDFGCGSGAIASYFGNPSGPCCEVDAVDVVDVREQLQFYRFSRLEVNNSVPVEGGSFNIILSNHVLEHVGERSAQVAYLKEIRRLLAPSGVGYLALPNRWMLVEPHYRIPFLSWLPSSWRSPYLRASGRGAEYDCTPLSMSELESCFGEVGLDYENVCFQVLDATALVEGKLVSAARMAAGMPEELKRLILPLMPTLCYLIRRRGGA